MGIDESCVVVLALFPRSICTEILACDKSTPELCSACVSVLNNLFAQPFFDMSVTQYDNTNDILLRIK